MERLTIRDENGEVHMICKQMCGDYGHECDGQIDVDMCQRYVAFDKLAGYEDLEEQGLLLKLPCNVGDTVYSALGEKVIKSEVLSVKYHCEAENHGVFIRERIIIETDDIVTEINFSDIGKTIFLTQEQAEKNLSCKE